MFDSIKDIIQDAKSGKPFIIADDEDRENEGDIIFPAQFITEELINLLMLKARGLICVAIDQEIAKKFDLKLHPRRNISELETAFAYSIDSKKNSSTGMSASDKVNTIKDLVNEQSTIDDFKVPGHIFPIIAKTNGVLERRGHTEAAVDIAKLASLKPVMVICEIINDDGSMARVNDLMKFARDNKMRISTVDKLVSYIQNINR